VSGISQAISGPRVRCGVRRDRRRARGRRRGQLRLEPALKLWPIARPARSSARSIGLSDYFLPSLDDAQALAEKREPQAILDWCFAHGARACC
jgi:2-dehydro-3-deoxygluconokinase